MHALGASRRWLLVLVVLLPVVVLVGAGVVAADVLTVRASLTDARGEVREARSALAEIDVDAAQRSLANARAELADAQARTTSRRWSLATYTPLAGPSFRVTREVAAVADVATELGELVVAEGAELLAADLGAQVRSGVIDLEPLLALRRMLDTLPIERLEEGRDRLAEPPSGWIPPQLRDARLETLELADETLTTLRGADAVTRALPGFLGAEEPRRYFVAMQTPAELRGTGGMIGYWGILAVDGGALTFGHSEALDAQDALQGGDADPAPGRIRSLHGPLDVTVDADPQFASRYGPYQATSFFPNVNLDPHVPAAARVILDLVALRTDQHLDGVILLDPIGLQSLLQVTGDRLPLPGDLAETFGREAELATDEFADLVTTEVYEVLGAGHSAARKSALQQLGDAALHQVFEGSWEPRGMLAALAEARTERHLQLFSESPDEQAAFADLGADGAMPASTGSGSGAGAGSGSGSDLLAVTANNAVGGKQDVHLGHGFDVDVRLDDVRRADDGALSAARRAEVHTNLDNPLPASGMDEYVIGNCVREDGTVGCFEGPPGWNWTWFTAWLPEGSRITSTTGEGPADPPAHFGRHRGFEAVDRHHATPPGERRGFSVAYEGRAPLVLDEALVVYEWSWWRQSKAIPDHLDVRIHPPAGWQVDEVEVVGGGAGTGMGVHGDGEELRSSLDGGAAHLQGTVTGHLRLRVHLTGD